MVGGSDRWDSETVIADRLPWCPSIVLILDTFNAANSVKSATTKSNVTMVSLGEKGLTHQNFRSLGSRPSIPSQFWIRASSNARFLGVGSGEIFKNRLGKASLVGGARGPGTRRPIRTEWLSFMHLRLPSGSTKPPSYMAHLLLILDRSKVLATISERSKDCLCVYDYSITTVGNFFQYGQIPAVGRGSREAQHWSLDIAT